MGRRRATTVVVLRRGWAAAAAAAAAIRMHGGRSGISTRCWSTWHRRCRRIRRTAATATTLVPRTLRSMMVVLLLVNWHWRSTATTTWLTVHRRHTPTVIHLLHVVRLKCKNRFLQARINRAMKQKAAARHADRLLHTRLVVQVHQVKRTRLIGNAAQTPRDVRLGRVGSLLLFQLVLHVLRSERDDTSTSVPLLFARIGVRLLVELWILDDAQEVRRPRLQPRRNQLVQVLKLRLLLRLRILAWTSFLNLQRNSENKACRGDARISTIFIGLLALLDNFVACKDAVANLQRHAELLGSSNRRADDCRSWLLLLQRLHRVAMADILKERVCDRPVHERAAQLAPLLHHSLRLTSDASQQRTRLLLLYVLNLRELRLAWTELVACVVRTSLRDVVFLLILVPVIQDVRSASQLQLEAAHVVVIQLHHTSK
mmetsp:Transcript_9907/g.26521  ORF Transcript_9907/g.26521 Transcript_9907/m.26521 type:complete len:429 (-) Transcript_9907:974-2260(-)